MCLCHWTTVQYVNPGKKLLMLSLDQEWLDIRYVTVAALFLKTFVCGGSWCTDTSFSLLLVKLSNHLFLIILRDEGCNHPYCLHTFPATLFSSSLLSINMHSAKRSSRIIFWTAVKPAVILMIVDACTELDSEIIVIYTSSKWNILMIWDVFI